MPMGNLWMTTLLVIIFVLINSIAYAGAWVQKKRGYYLKLANSYVNTSKEFDHLGNRKNILQDFEVFENADYREVTISAYVEYGLFDRLTVVADVPFKFATSSRTEISNYYENGMRDVSHTTTGFGDLRLLGRLNLLQLPLVVSVQPGVKIPLGYDESGDIEGPALGTSELEYEGQLLVGQSLYPLPIYLTGGIGYRFREGPLHDEVFYNVEAGYTAGRILFKASISGVDNTTTPQDIFGEPIQLPLPGGGGAVPDRLFGDQNFLKINGGITYNLKKNFAIDGQVFNIASGKNIVTGTTFQIGLVLTK